MPAVSQSFCSTCGESHAKYRCPGCKNPSCSLTCVQKHKEKLVCDGKRPIAHFIATNEFNQSDLLSDYRFLEQVERSLYGKKYNRIVHSNQMYPVVVDYLRRGAFKRGIKLKFLSLGMQKRHTNSSMFNRRSDSLNWKIDWQFPLSDVTYTDKLVDDKRVIQSALDAYLSLDQSTDAIRQSLKKYFMNLDQIRVVMSNELVGSQKRYFVVDTSKTLGDFLVGKTIVEYPTFIVTLQPFLNRYKLIPKEEEDALTLEMRERRLNKFFNYQDRNNSNSHSSTNQVSSRNERSSEKIDQSKSYQIDQN
ncbi:box C/D snoRNA protein 1-like [Symsagittifera roscoffensis]|uniref:box C/D snoRNA protein 1-like n=1 Tax=Symsagittifera roscoffensis TaxID=84072 RepID=UPI00307B59D6